MSSNTGDKKQDHSNDVERYVYEVRMDDDTVLTNPLFGQEHSVGGQSHTQSPVDCGTESVVQNPLAPTTSTTGVLPNMFSMRHYRSLRDEDDSHTINEGKSALYNCVEEGTAITPTITSVSTSFSSTNTTINTTTSGNTKTTTTSPLSIQSLRAAWRNLTSLGLGSSRLPHLERHDHVVGAPESHDYRYTHFPNTTSKRQKETTFHNTHIHLTPNSRTYTHPHRSPVPPPPLHHQHLHQQVILSNEPLSLAKCLKKHREKRQGRGPNQKSKSDNTLQKVGVHIKSHSDQNLHKVWLGGGTGTCNTVNVNSIFSNVQLTGDTCRSDSGSGSSFHSQDRHLCHIQQQSRTRSLERNRGTKIHPVPPFTLHRHTRSLERNHKFKVDLRPLPPAADEPPEHLAPPPPIITPTHIPWSPDCLEGSGGSVSSSTSSSISGRGMEGQGTAGSFINKPAKGWLHRDQQLAEDGICYGVRYIGCLEVNTSMKNLNFDTRSLIAKECISRVCESAGLKTADRKRKVVKLLGRILGERPLMDHAGSNVTLAITSTALTLTVLESNVVIATHEMPNISFASGGDPDTLDFIAYVAKDNRYGRACFVLECGGGLAQDVITTIGQAFELRFKEYLKKTPSSVQYTNVKSDRTINEENPSRGGPEYYNDLPGKVPPDLPLSHMNPHSQLGNSTVTSPLSDNKHVLSASGSTTVPVPSDVPTSHPTNVASALLEEPASAQSLNSLQQRTNKGVANLIDLNTELPRRREPEYVNGTVINKQIDQKDPFDMQPFVTQLPQSNAAQSTAQTAADCLSTTNKTLPLSQRKQLEREPWFHKAIGRKEAEQLLIRDGDFLVRESQGTPGQYVLTGMQNNTKKHLLLVNPEGVVRTKCRTFDSVSHLINYHRENELPIVSAESALVLRNPVMCHLIR